MSGPVPGYPIPIQDPNLHEVRADPDEDNPNELVLEAAEVNEGLPPLARPEPVPSQDDEHKP